jgi:hypothetical protein
MTYSVDCADWQEVPEIDPTVEEQCKYEQGMFIGDPTVRIKFRDLVCIILFSP